MKIYLFLISLAVLTAACRKRESERVRNGQEPREAPVVAQRPSVTRDAGVHRDAAVRSDEMHPPGRLDPTSPLFIVTGGVERARRGARFALGAFLREPDGGLAVEVTDRVRFRVEPTSVGEITDGRYFEARAFGRAQIVAELGARQGRAIIEVSDEVSPDASVAPEVSGDGGSPLRYLHFIPGEHGAFVMRVAFLDRSIEVTGTMRGSRFPMTVAVTTPGSDGGTSAEPTTGRVIFERRVGTALYGVTDLRTPQGPLRLRFALSQPDPTAGQAAIIAP